MLWDSYNAFYGRHGVTALPVDISDSTWRRLLDAAEPMHGLVAQRDGLIVGLVHFIFHRNTIMTADTCYIQDLFTQDSVRGRGIGRALVEAVYSAAIEAGAGGVYWHTHQTNTAAKRLYDTVAEDTGFTVYRHRLEGASEHGPGTPLERREFLNRAPRRRRSSHR